MIDFRELIKAGSHFGHQTSRWCPKMKPYIWGLKNKVHLIDVSKIAFNLEKAGIFLEQVAAENKQILFVGTKKPAQQTVKDIATRIGMPYVNHRWIGGTLTNNGQVKLSVTKLLHYEDVLARSEESTYYTKKELNTFQKVVERLQKSVGGIRTLVWPVGAIVLVDVRKEQSALLEAVAMGIPVVAIVDTDSDPSGVSYVIPGNDDAPKSIAMLLGHLATFVEKGKEAAKKKVDAQKEAAELTKKEKMAAKGPAKAVAKKEAAPKAEEDASAATTQDMKDSQ